MIFAGTSQAISIHLGESGQPFKYRELQQAVPSRASCAYDRLSSADADPPIASHPSHPSRITVDTGGGTDHDDPMIRARQAFAWEEIFDAAAPRWGPGHRWEWMKDFVNVRVGGSAMVWLGLHPQRHDHRPRPEQGVTLDLRMGDAGWEPLKGRRATTMDV